MTQTTKHIQSIDVHEKAFLNNINLTMGFINQLRNPHDKMICKKWIHKLYNLKSDSVVVKKNRNNFLKYLMQFLHKIVAQEKELPDGGTREQAGDENVKEFMSTWSSDRKTYVAAKPIPGKGILIYLAVLNNPNFGWE